jgi:hypothetical protein
MVLLMKRMGLLMNRTILLMKRMGLLMNRMIMLMIRDFQIKKCLKTDEKTLSISPLSVFSVSLWFVYLDNLFLGSLLDI